MEIVVEGDANPALLPGEVKYLGILGRREPSFADVQCVPAVRPEQECGFWSESLVQ
jgi:hypothetical protein